MNIYICVCVCVVCSLKGVSGASLKLKSGMGSRIFPQAQWRKARKAYAFFPCACWKVLDVLNLILSNSAD